MTNEFFLKKINSNRLASGELEMIASKTPSNEDHKLHKGSGSRIELKTLMSIKYFMCHIGANVESAINDIHCRSRCAVQLSQCQIQEISNCTSARIPTSSTNAQCRQTKFTNHLAIVVQDCNVTFFLFLLLFFIKKNGQTKKICIDRMIKQITRLCEYAVALPRDRSAVGAYEDLGNNAYDEQFNCKSIVIAQPLLCKTTLLSPMRDTQWHLCLKQDYLALWTQNGRIQNYLKSTKFIILISKISRKLFDHNINDVNGSLQIYK
ncbi:hypothetical protein RFI_05271 [Reticulomyxa filosa]|uniref:Uncharacterized protein n=1 Tax=Reticulomyxa filosa TaxID=46433 RepID=X6P0V2_RETFI|nr:hypothetical protein RFI_05271 [Reticulomyxa filosa]|eukprot:ETO31846.1 hypothetical protein RFI_05271 [Reticulomyxa filosa]